MLNIYPIVCMNQNNFLQSEQGLTETIDYYLIIQCEPDLIYTVL